ncbi:UDP-N-acetylmuramoyl-tripeptide--D-alanyl-D-alanine ligase [Dermabacteraceae bacterium TAE3-ERU27]|nr:UDP-N-acetylmuramoyl-tripeptide--D-alanyl-D-alanine ligase [Dermabacteraceae bacterium TAE3-ERU27]
MVNASIAEIAQIVGGRIHGVNNPGASVSGAVSIDTRTLREGDIFAAFVGERVDGHDYVPVALEKGASLVLSTREVAAPSIVVPDMLEALTVLARELLRRERSRRHDLTVLAVTGSAGKTSTKDLLGELCATSGETIAPAGSFNNELGLPLTVLGINETTRFLVLEMGARGIGHIAHLTDIAPPDISLALNIGSAHAGEFGGIEFTQRAKSEIISALSPAGRAILNATDPRVRAMADVSAAPVIFWGDTDSPVRAENVTLNEAGAPGFELIVEPGMTTLQGEEISPYRGHVQLSLLGKHQVANALAAVAAALVAGVSAQNAVEVLAKAQPRSRYRMEVSERSDGVTIINDAYNANPDSMRAALETLSHLGKERRTVAVLGTMLELGEESAEEHRKIGREAADLGVSLLLSVGSREIYEGALEVTGYAERTLYAPDNDAARDILETTVKPGDVVLFKSSHGARLFTLGESLATLMDGETEE